MRLNLKVTNITLMPEARAYLDKKLHGLEGLLDVDDPAVLLAVELGRATRRHQTGDVFYAETTVYRGRSVSRASATAASITAAIDEMRDALAGELQSAKGKRLSLVRQSGLLVKAILRGGYHGLGAGLRYLGYPAQAGRRLARLARRALAQQAAAGFWRARAGWRYLRQKVWRR